MTEQAPDGGHSVLVIPVPELNPWVRERTAFYDRSFLADDPSFVNAHITLLGPWLPKPTATDLASVRAIAAGTRPFDFVLDDIAAFPGGIIYLRPLPSAPFTDLTAKLVAAFPAYPPYAGAFPDPIPHLTLDQIGDQVSLASVRACLSDLVPIRARASHIDLQWWNNDDCHLVHRWPLGR